QRRRAIRMRRRACLRLTASRRPDQPPLRRLSRREKRPPDFLSAGLRPAASVMISRPPSSSDSVEAPRISSVDSSTSAPPTPALTVRFCGTGGGRRRATTRLPTGLPVVFGAPGGSAVGAGFTAAAAAAGSTLRTLAPLA